MAITRLFAYGLSRLHLAYQKMTEPENSIDSSQPLICE